MAASDPHSQTINMTGKQAFVLDLAKRAKRASRRLARTSHSQRILALHEMARGISEGTEQILLANKEDLHSFEKLPQAPQNRDVLRKRLALSVEKIQEIVSGIKNVAALPDPVGEILLARELDKELRLYKITCPIGLVAVIFESRTDALPQILSLCLKSSNAAILKGGREAEKTNKTIFACVQEALSKTGFDQNIFALTHKREDAEQLLSASGIVDLIVPRGSNELVRYIMEHTQIPVLGHAAGVCHIYVDSDAEPGMAIKICLDAKISYPAACNAVETILVHEGIAGRFVPEIVRSFDAAGVEMRCDQQALGFLPNRSFSGCVKEACEEDFGHEFSNLTVAMKIVDSIDAAIDHINCYSSKHTDTIITGNQKHADRFFEEVDSAGVYHNASTRFADGFRYGFGAEVGIATGVLHPRGPVGVDGLVTYKYKIEGNGHIVADYTGENPRSFTHIDLVKSPERKDQC